MNTLYNIISALPFEFAQYQFMQRALLAVIIIAPLFALLGTMAVNNKMAFFSDALGHSAFTGIAIGTLLGLNNPLISLIAFGIFLGLVISRVKASSSSSSDTVISVFSSISIALGIVILSHNGNFSSFSSYLIGDILTITTSEIILLIFVLIAAYIIWTAIYNKLMLVSINTSLAASRGISTTAIENIFVVLVAVAVMLSVRCIGILTINSLLILPAASARNISKNSMQYHIFSTIIALVCSIFGLVISYYFDTSAGATMVLLAAAVFFITLLLKRNIK